MEFFYKNNGVQQYGELLFRSGDRPDNLRGDGIDLLIIDEAAFVNPYVWVTLRPALVDRQGSALFISTPNGLNWFYKMYMRGLDKEKFPRWNSYHYTSYDNPYILGTEIDDAKNEMTDSEFRREHLAEFHDDAGLVFRKVDDAAIVPFNHELRRDHTHTYVMGIDWGRKNDATVISIIDVTTNRQVRIDRMVNAAWNIQRDRVLNAIREWRPTKIMIEENAAGQPVIEDLMQLGVQNIEPFYTSSTSKTPLILGLAQAFERGTLQILEPTSTNSRIQLEELKSYEQRRSKNGLNWTFGAPSGMNDDTVMALALAWRAVASAAPAVITVQANPFYGPYTAPKPITAMSAIKQQAHELKKALLEGKNATGDDIRKPTR
jgi:phage FluMu gp28-like protein